VKTAEELAVSLRNVSPEHVRPTQSPAQSRITFEERRKRVLECFLAGMSIAETAKVLHTAFTTVRVYLKDPTFQEELQKLSETAHRAAMAQIQDSRSAIQDRLEEIAWKGLDELEELIEQASSEHIKLKAADSILDRYEPTSRRGAAQPVGGNTFNLNQLGVFLQQAAVVAEEVDAGHSDTRGAGSSVRIARRSEEEGA
jgi:predicted transcriptional regulator